MARERLLEGKDIKIVYDDPWFWKVSAYRESIARPRPRDDRPRQRDDIPRPRDRPRDDRPRNDQRPTQRPRSPSNSPPRQRINQPQEKEEG
jgi:hypothetical protein